MVEDRWNAPSLLFLVWAPATACWLGGRIVASRRLVGEDGRGVSDGSSFSLFLLIFSTFLEHGFAFSFPVDSGHPVQRGPL